MLGLADAMSDSRQLLFAILKNSSTAHLIVWNLIEALLEAIQGGTQIHGKISGVVAV